MRNLLNEGDVKKVSQFLKEISAAEKARVISRLAEENRNKLLAILGPENAARLLLDLPDEQVADLMEEIKPEEAAAIVDQMPGEEQADILSDIRGQNAEAILEAMPQADAQKARQLMTYPEHTAGGIMGMEFLSYNEGKLVGEVLKDMEVNRGIYSDYHVQYAYITSAEGHLRGVLRMRDLPFSPHTVAVITIMNPRPISVRVDAPLDDLIQIFEANAFLGIPVTDEAGRLVGVVRRIDVMEAEGERDRNSFLKASGIVGGEEFRSMPLVQRSSKRLSWLVLNIFLNVISASVIAFYQDTLVQVIALAVFLPIISDMSGNSGIQAITVSIRELTLGLVKPYELLTVLFKEIWLGVINGLILGVLLGMVAFLWKGNLYLGLVVGGALMVNTIVSVLVGGTLPLVLKKMKMDPALAAGPVLTTVTDMCGFFFALSFAKALLPLLT